MLNDDRRTTEEAYTSATNTSDLRVEADRRGDADVLLAAGWSQSRVGAALLRLHSEYDGAEKPRTALPAQFLPGLTGSAKQRRTASAVMANAYNVHEAGLLLAKLKALPAIREQLTLRLEGWGTEDAAAVGVSVLRWWLAQNCPACGGTKYQVIEGTGRHSGKACKTCGGSGLRPLPHGQVGRRLANWMDDSVHRARQQIGSRLRTSMDRA